MQSYSLYLCGVGGQGIGLLSEILLRAADYAGYVAKAVDTHGLAQRGGTVISQIRLGTTVCTPMIPAGSADLVIALERHEALRGLQTALRDNGTLMYYNTVLQPLGVRLGRDVEVSAADILAAAALRGIEVFQVERPGLADARMQNMVALAAVCRQGLVPGLERGYFLRAMDDLLAGSVLAANLQLFAEA